MKPGKSNKIEREKQPPKAAQKVGLFKSFGDDLFNSFAVLFNRCQQKPLWPTLFLELSFAVSLSVAYYFLVRPYATGVPNNSTNFWVFSSCSVPDFHLFQLNDVLKGRISGLLFAGWLFDFLIKGNTINIEEYSNVFALYQSLWLLLLFVVIILALRNSLLINLGIFAGLAYNNLSPVTGLYIYPYDMPATVFFTLAVLLFARHKIFQMMIVICLGCFFKETVLVCALLLFFVDEWKWWGRLLSFVGVMSVYAVGKRLLLGHLHFEVAAFSMDYARKLSDLLGRELIPNIHKIMKPTLNHIVFVNVGGFVAALVLGWQRRFLPYMVMLLAYLAGLFLYTGITEYRNFMQSLPLCLMILAERWQDLNWPSVAPPSPPALQSSGVPAIAAPPWRLRGTLPILTLVVVLLGGVSVAIPGWQYHSLLQTIQYQFDNHTRFVEDLKAKAGKGDGPSQLALGRIYLNGEWLKVDNVEAYKWFRLAQLQGVSDAAMELTNCAAAMSQEQINAAEDEARQWQNGRQ